jgi:hypothetical protein
MVREGASQSIVINGESGAGEGAARARGGACARMDAGVVEAWERRAVALSAVPVCS